MRLHFVILAATVLTFISACKKWDDCAHHPPRRGTVCNLAQVVETGIDKGQVFSRLLFRVVFDPQTGKQHNVVSHLLLGYLGPAPGDSLSMVVKWDGKRVYFLREDDLADTVVVAIFNDQNRLLEMRLGHALDTAIQTALFSYTDAGRLYDVNFPYQYALTPEYDAAGNVTAIKDRSHSTYNIFYTYDASIKATDQYYSDELTYFDYRVVLAYYMGWLPDLKPTAARILAQVRDFDLANDPHYDASLTDQVYEGKKLVQYETSYGRTFSNSYHCSQKH